MKHSILIILLLIATSSFANEQFDKMPPSEHMERAKRVMKQLNAKAAKLHLQAIPTSAPEYPEAKRLLATLPALEKKQANLARKDAIGDRERKKLLNEAAAQIRKEFAKTYERQLLDKGLDAYAVVGGKNNTTLRLKWVLVSRPLVHKLCNDQDFINNLRGMGFKKLLLSDGYNSSWTVDL